MFQAAMCDTGHWGALRTALGFRVGKNLTGYRRRLDPESPTGSSPPIMPSPPLSTPPQHPCEVEMLEEKNKTFCKQMWYVCNPNSDL